MIETENAVLAALRTRRSVPKMQPTLPPRRLIEQIIAAATWAPNHHRTAPWRFIVLAGEERAALGEVMAAETARTLENPESEAGRAALAKQRAKPLRAPVLIVVAAVPQPHPKAIEIEEIEAVAAGVENMLLAAESLGLGAMWRTGKPAYSAAVKRHLGLPPGAHIVAFVYVGRPDVPAIPREHASPAPYIDWRWDGESG